MIYLSLWELAYSNHWVALDSVPPTDSSSPRLHCSLIPGLHGQNVYDPTPVIIPCFRRMDRVPFSASVWTIPVPSHASDGRFRIFCHWNCKMHSGWDGDRVSERENGERSRSPTPPLEPEMFQAKSPEVRGMFPPVEPDGFRLSLSEVFPKVSSRRTGGCGGVAELLFGLALRGASRLIRKGFEQSR